MISQRSAAAGSSPFAIVDVVAAFLAVTWLISLVEIPPLPIAPSVYGPFILLVAADSRMLTAWERLARSRIVWWLGGFFLLRAGLELATGPFSATNQLAAARVVAALTGLLALASYAASCEKRWRRLLVVSAFVLAISLTWFLLELTVGQPLIVWRAFLYRDIYAGETVLSLDALRTGLSPFVHLLGYQVAFLLPLSAMLAATARTKVVGHTAIVLTVLSLLALAASLQRSALLASIVALALAAAAAPASRIRLVRVGLVGAVVAGVLALGAARGNETLRVMAEASLAAKLKSGESGRDSRFRVQLQGRAIEVLSKHPLGLRIAGRDWGEIGFMNVHRRTSEVPFDYEVPFAPHNAYLTDGIALGVASVVAGVIAAVLLLLHAWRVMRSTADAAITGVAAALIGLLTAQALTHNAGLPTAEPATMLAAALVLGAGPGSVVE
ncbi:MAG: O-antigen ligase family protein [Gemmatimonadota bacterium]